MNNTNRYAIYIRVANEEQHNKDLSMSSQRRILQEYIESNGYTIADYYADENVSARAPMKQRKEFLRLLEDVKQDKFDTILVTQPDRWISNADDYNTTEELLLEHNCRLKMIYEMNKFSNITSRVSVERVKRCAIYIRVSTEEQHLNGLSLPAQRKALTEYAERNGYTVIGFYADEGISARKPMKYRKGLLRLLEDVKQDKIDMILVTKLDRWFRNIKDYNITEEILRAHNCYWKTIFENYDSSTANGQMVINIMLSVNQAECDRTSERIKAVLDYKRSIGEVTSGMCACYGYKVVNNRLVKDEAVSDIVEDAYEHYRSCYSIRNTLRFLEEKYGDRAPSCNKVDRLFKNETYAGRDKDDLNYCEPYITYEELQKFRQIAASKTYTTGRYDPYIFSSLIKCPWCGNNYTGYRKKRKLKNGGESIYIKYRCGNKFGRHSCAHFTEHKIEEYMLTHASARLQEEITQIQLKSKQQHKRRDTVALRKELDRLNILFQKGRISESYYDEQYDLLEQKIKECDGGTDNIVPLSSYDGLLEAFSGNWQEIYLKLDKAHKQAFWKSTIKSIEIDRDTHQISGFNFLI